MASVKVIRWLTSRLALAKIWSRISSGHSSSMMVFSSAPPRTWSEGEIG